METNLLHDPSAQRGGRVGGGEGVGCICDGPTAH